MVGALIVADLARVVTEIELVAVATKVGFAYVVIHADDAAPEDRKVVFDRVGVSDLKRTYSPRV